MPTKSSMGRTTTGSAKNVYGKLPYERAHVEHRTELDLTTGTEKRFTLLRLHLRDVVAAATTMEDFRFGWADDDGDDDDGKTTFRIGMKWDGRIVAALLEVETDPAVRQVLHRAMGELRGVFGRPPPGEEEEVWSEGLYYFNEPMNTTNYLPEILKLRDDESPSSIRYVLQIRFEVAEHKEGDDQANSDSGSEPLVPPVLQMKQPTVRSK